MQYERKPGWFPLIDRAANAAGSALLPEYGRALLKDDAK